MRLAEIHCESKGRLLIVVGALGADDANVEGLRSAGHAPLLAEGPDGALDRIAEGGVRAIVCPLAAPGVDGLELLKRVRGLDPDARIPFLVIGRPGSFDGLEACLAAGADDFVPGPAVAEDILARLLTCEARAARAARMQHDVAAMAREVSKASARLEVANQRMRRDLEAAAKVQRALLPSPGLRVPHMEVAWRLQPCEELGGDILNYFRVDEHYLGFYLLDVSGHGAASAMLSVQVARLMTPMMSASELLKERVNHAPWYRVVDPKSAVSKLNDLFRLEEGPTRFFTIVYGLLEIASGRLRMVNAGHPSPFHVPAGGRPSALECHGHPVGVFQDLRLDELELVLAPGERLWLYSDGIAEAGDGSGSQFGVERLGHAIARQAPFGVESAVAGVLDEVQGWCGPRRPEDDRSLLVIERLAARDGGPSAETRER